MCTPSLKQRWSNFLSDGFFLSNRINVLFSRGTFTHETGSLIGAAAGERFDFHGESLSSASSARVMSASISPRTNFL